MPLRVVGAGFGRTGTNSLKVALEKLLGAPCYHMIEVFAHPEHVPLWHQASLGNMPDWDKLFDGYAAAVDFPASVFWPELMKAYPDALVLLSVRDPDAWWQSASETIFGPHDAPMITEEWRAMVRAMFARQWAGKPLDRESSIAALQENTQRVLREVPRERLLVWDASEGWEPICKALELPVPNEPFPRTNTREDWRAREAAAKAGKAPELPGMTPHQPNG
ncbi:MAG TPA: sulfotransferase [Rhizomicrobium sp.]